MHFLLWAQIYSNIYSNFGLKYIGIFVREDFNHSTLFAYLFDEVLVFFYLNICSDSISHLPSSLRSLNLNKLKNSERIKVNFMY